MKNEISIESVIFWVYRCLIVEPCQPSPVFVIQFSFTSGMNFFHTVETYFESITKWTLSKHHNKDFWRTDFWISVSLFRNLIMFTTISSFSGSILSIVGTSKCLWECTNYYTPEKKRPDVRAAMGLAAKPCLQSHQVPDEIHFWYDLDGLQNWLQWSMTEITVRTRHNTCRGTRYHGYSLSYH